MHEGDRSAARRSTKGEVVACAREWAAKVGARTPGFVGAFLHGSILDEADDARVSPWSDVDVVVVLDQDDPPVKAGKLLFQGTLLDVTYVSWERLRVPERLLADYHLAPSLARIHILADPDGRLAQVNEVTAQEYAKPQWIERRVLDARENALDKLRSVRKFDRLHDQVMAWVFGAGILCHVLLVAGLKNPTVRKRYLAVRELLAARGREDVYEELLRLLGCSQMRSERACEHLERMTAAFDDAKAVRDSPFLFSTDVSDLARPISVDGSREMIERGDHREAIFWIVATYCRSLKILEAGGRSWAFEKHYPGFVELIADLGVATAEDVEKRADEVEAALPAVMEVALSLIPKSA